ncbi:MAG: flagellar biosynthesis protein FlhF [Treponema sp.]|jgi:flagellar biosynthesis protein FlhF|nr:flagellar biosynthesis protein FlhF [Treponema sp.]
MAEILVERGASRGDCVHKIVSKYGIYFNILRERTISPSGLFKLFSREEVEVEFSLYPPQLGQSSSPPSGQPQSRKRPAAIADNEEDESNLVDFEEKKKELLRVAGKNPDKFMRAIKENKDREAGQQLIIDKLNAIMEKQEQINAKNAPKQDHPSLLRVTQLLRQNEFSERYINGLLDRARKELPLETLDDFNAVQNQFLVWIGESIKIYKPQKEEHHSGAPAGRIIVLVGPTGVGKTTTIAKLAVVYGCGIGGADRQPLSVRVYTIDTFKIGGSDQLQKYCEVMEVVPFAIINNDKDLRKEIDMYREETDLILIDTIGSSPNDPKTLGEMNALLNICGSKAETYLVLSAITKTNDIEHIIRQFEPFNYQAVLLTKMDETRTVGNIISALAEKGKPVSFITNGQQIHKDIKKANVVGFLINLEGFNVDRDEMEKRFPAAKADKFL